MDDQEFKARRQVENFRLGLSREVPGDYNDAILNSNFTIWQQETISSHLAEDIAGLEALQYYIEPSGQSDKAKEILKQEKNLTSIGKFLKEQCPGKTMYDLCCGLPTHSSIPRDMAEVFEAREYVGIDLFIHDKKDNKEARQHEKKRRLLQQKPEIKFDQQGNLPIFWIEDEMLAFLSRIKKGKGSIFYFSGIETPPHNPDITKYAQHLENELARISQAGDIIIIDKIVTNLPINPTHFGFELVKFNQIDTNNMIYIKK